MGVSIPDVARRAPDMREDPAMPSVRSKASLLAATALLAFSAAAPVAAQDTRGTMGGGFIEFLMTGNTPAPRQGVPQHYAPSPRRSAAMPAQTSAALHTGSIIAPHQTVAYAAPPDAMQYRFDDPLDQRQAMPQHRGPQGTHAPAPVEGTFDPRFERQEVAYPGRHAPGTIVIDTPNRFLYLVQGNGRALRYGIGVGRPGFEWAGAKAITRKAEWPDWRPPAQMLKRRPDLPTFMAGGPENPLGARALYLGSSLYRIHGTNEPQTIGQAVSSGCIRMRNEDVMDLYNRVRVGTRVVVI
jgi:lipoprotein-anchoring transpeptidase ErfK/SrfK